MDDCIILSLYIYLVIHNSVYIYTSSLGPCWGGQINQVVSLRGVGGSDSPLSASVLMAVFHDEVEIEEFQHDEDSEMYFCPCLCGDDFSITSKDLENGEDVAMYLSCSFIITLIYDKDHPLCVEKQSQTLLPTKN